MERIELPRPLAIALLQHAQGSPDDEVCGLIAARDGEPVRVLPISNAASDAAVLFEMDERELVDAFKAMREQGEDLYAIYHSHPQTAPVPSARDIKRAGYPDALHLIVSMEIKGVLQMRGWRLNGDQPQPVEVGVQEDT